MKCKLNSLEKNKKDFNNIQKDKSTEYIICLKTNKKIRGAFIMNMLQDLHQKQNFQYYPSKGE